MIADVDRRRHDFRPRNGVMTHHYHHRVQGGVRVSERSYSRGRRSPKRQRHSVLLRVHRGRLDPLAAPVLLAHGETCDAQIIRNISDDQRAEPRVGEEGHREREVDEHSCVATGVLYQRFPVVVVSEHRLPKLGEGCSPVEQYR